MPASTGTTVASGSIAQAKRAGKQAKAAKISTSDKWAGKRKIVAKGDVVQFRANNGNQTGNVGVVLGYVSKHEFIVRTFGGADSDFGPMFVSVFDRQPNSEYLNAAGENVGHRMYYYSNWIMGIVHSETPKKKKVRKPVQFHEITHAELPAVLSGEQVIPDGHKVVLLPAPVTP